MIILICSDINHVIDEQNMLNGLIAKEFFINVSLYQFLTNRYQRLFVCGK